VGNLDIYLGIYLNILIMVEWVIFLENIIHPVAMI
jgi:hypothetical protein